MKTTILLFIIVTLVTISFLLWGGSIDNYVVSAIEANQSNKIIIALILFTILSSDIILPIPSSLLSTFCGLYLGLYYGFFISFTAMTISAAIGYIIGRYFSRSTERFIGKEDTEKLERFNNKYGSFLLIGLRPVPVLAETSLVFAGMIKYPVINAFFQVIIGNAIVSLIYVLFGVYSRNNENSFVYAFIGTILISAVFILIPRLLRRGKI